jgi:hypothetical protein
MDTFLKLCKAHAKQEKMIVVLVNTALRAPFSTRFEHSRKTWDWFASQNMNVIRLVGDADVSESTLQDGILTVPVEDKWEFMGIKLWYGLLHLLRDASICGIFKLDDDVDLVDAVEGELVLAKLIGHPYGSLGVGMARQDSPTTYAQCRVSAQSPWKAACVHVPFSFPYARGSFLWLDRLSMEHLVSPQSLIAFAQSPIEDMTVGQILCKHGTPLTIVTTSAFTWGNVDESIGSSMVA